MDGTLEDIAIATACSLDIYAEGGRPPFVKKDFINLANLLRDLLRELAKAKDEIEALRGDRKWTS